MNAVHAAYRALGWNILPIVPKTKQAAIKWRDLQDRIASDDEVEGWPWSDSIGVVTGAISGIIVLDIDTEEGARIVASHGGMPRTPTVITGQPHKRHYYLRHPGMTIRGRVGLLPGVDLRADGGLTVLPPSPHKSGATYRWEITPDEPLADPPEWLLRLIAKPEREQTSAPGTRASFTTGTTSKYARTALEQECGRILRTVEGARNDQLNKSAFSLGQLVAGGELSEHEVRDALHRAARAVGLPDREALPTIESGVLSGMQYPRQRPNRHSTSNGHSKTNGANQAGHEQTTDEQPPTSTQLIYLHDKQPTPPDWLIKDVLPLSQCIVIAAEPKTGKTWLSLAIAIALAKRGTFLGQWECSCTGKTLLISPEGGIENIRRRLWGLCWGHGYDPHTVLPSIGVWPGRINLANDKQYKQLHATIAEHKPELLIVDPLISAHRGVDEDKATEMQPLLDKIRDLQTAHPPLTILATHHTSKASKDRSPLYAMRGSSALAGWLDGLLAVTRLEDTTTTDRKLEVWLREAASPDPIAFQLLATQSAVVDGLPAMTLQATDLPPPASKVKDDARFDRQMKLTQLITKTPGILTSDLASKLGRDRKTIGRDLEALERRGLIIRHRNEAGTMTGKNFPNGES